MQWPLLFVPAFSVILKCQALVQREDIVYARVCATTDPHSRNFKMWEMSSGSTFQELVLRFGRVSWDRALREPSSRNPTPQTPQTQKNPTLNSFGAFAQEAFDNAMTDLDSLDAEQCPTCISTHGFDPSTPNP